jgi:hypothetical protein
MIEHLPVPVAAAVDAFLKEVSAGR